jgi:tetratricopeptide (TPR) repeat protein
VIDNKLLTAPDGLRRIWFSFDSPSQYFPLVYTVFRIEHAVWGLNPAGFHWVNILLHGANALLLWRLLARLQIPGALLSASIFALHPVQVESVAWVTELKNVLMGFFFLLSLLAWTRFIGERTRFSYSLSLGFYALALFSKTTLPAALLLFVWLQERRIDTRRLIQIVPFVFLGLGMGLVTVWWERYHQGTQGKIFALGLPERILVASHAVWFYAGKLIWPANLTFSYPHWKIVPADPRSCGWLVALCGLGWVAFLARRFVGWSVCAALAFFVTTLGPVLGFFMLYTFRYSYVADHYQYLACIGPITLFSAGIAKLHGVSRNLQSLAIPGFCAILLGALCTLTWRQCETYRDMETLWRTTIARNPSSCLATNNLGLILYQRGETSAAMDLYRKALEIDPGYYEACNNLGVALRHEGRVIEAIASYRRALAVWPEYHDAHNNLANVLLQQGRIDEAIDHYRQAIATNPADAEGYCGLGNALLLKERTGDAVSLFQTSLEINPAFTDAHNYLGNIFLQQGRTDEAISHYRAALEIDPNSAGAHYNLGNAYLETNRLQEAIAQYRKTLVLSPGFVDAHDNLGIALLQSRHTREAFAHFQTALAGDPSDVNAQVSLAWMLAASPDDSLRNGARAFDLAQQAHRLSGGKNPLILRALAAAYAETGHFVEARETTKRALDLATRNRSAALSETLRAQIKSYEADTPYRDMSLLESSSPKP